MKYLIYIQKFQIIFILKKKITIFNHVFDHILYYNFNKVPKKFGNIPYVSGLPLMWALIRQKPHSEVEEILSKTSGDHELYLVEPTNFILTFFFSREKKL